jgi:hypothetical protein
MVEFGLKFFFGSTEKVRHTVTPDTWTLSPERKKAMQDACIWNDPAKREAVILGYMKFDMTEGK